MFNISGFWYRSCLILQLCANVKRDVMHFITSELINMPSKWFLLTALLTYRRRVEEVMISSASVCLSVCLLAGLCKTILCRFSQNSMERRHTDHAVFCWYSWWRYVWVRAVFRCRTSHWVRVRLVTRFNSNSLDMGWPLSELKGTVGRWYGLYWVFVRAVLSAILISLCTPTAYMSVIT